ncbi:nucleotidyltransferase domain-containing protein [Streptomyces sp. NPDC060334]|uniref:nucleotidyltransferase domain-containing protein n=1 Tax=unclassified Streptomyces TaxID=2593676 RepID=UPI003328451E
MGRADRQLRLIAEIVQVAAALRIEVWLRGGWAMDFFLGEVTRDHEDIDWFAWTADAGALAEGLLAHGCQPVPGPTPDLQLDFAKDGLDISLTLLGRDMAGRVVVAGGPWAGAPWPEGMLDAEPGRIGGLRDSTARPFAFWPDTPAPRRRTRCRTCFPPYSMSWTSCTTRAAARPGERPPCGHSRTNCRRAS